MGRFRFRFIVALVALPLVLGAQTPPKEISVISERGSGTIPISEFRGVEMIPVRGIASFVGVTVRPASERGAVTLSANGKIARVSDGRNFVPVQGRLVLLQSPARLVGDEWFVPLDFLTKVLPALASEAVMFRESERMLVLGSSFPRIQIRTRHDPTFTRVAIESDRPVSMTHSVDEDAIRVRIETPFLSTSFREEDIRDDVVERITLEREELGYVVTVYLGQRFGELKTDVPRHPRDALVLDLVRSRVPTRAARGVDEVEWDLSKQQAEDEEDAEGGEAGAERDGGEDDDNAPNPDVEEIFLNEGTHYLPDAPLVRPPPTSGPEQLRIVTLDPGHGGAETGAEGQGGAIEKDVVLSLSRRLRSLLQERLGVRVILTRDGDRELSLDERAAIANSNKSDLFLSIHADASPRRNARGSSVYFLSHTSTLAQPSASGGGDLDFILWDMAQTSHLSQSSKLAEILQEELQAVTGTERINRGIKQNSFRVLKGATMPAVLVEVGFISNVDEEKLLGSSAYQDKLAEALYRGVLRYRDLFEYQRTADNAQRSQR
jgi:N-acetylmuramoyl-L-alanine amidase